MALRRLKTILAVVLCCLLVPAVATLAEVSAVAGEAGAPTMRVQSQHHERDHEAILGSSDPDSGFYAEVRLTPFGAGIERILLTRYTVSVESDDKFIVQEVLPRLPEGETIRSRARYGVPQRMPMGAKRIVVDGQPLDLGGVIWTREQLQTDGDEHHAVYTARVFRSGVEDGETAGEDQAVLLIRRRFTLSKGSYELRVDQRIRNLSDQPVSFSFLTQGPGDIMEEVTYMGDRREIVTGYLNRQRDPSGRLVFTDRVWDLRSSVISSRDGLIRTAHNEGRTISEFTGRPFWPNPSVAGDHIHLAWPAFTNRYFASAVHRPAFEREGAHYVDPIDRYFDIGLEVFEAMGKRHMLLVLTTPTAELEPGRSADFDLLLYSGPRDPAVFAQEPYRTYGFEQLIRYNLGGMCAFCTFQWLAELLMAFLKLIFAITADWALSIIVLVVVVRLLLHPITRKSQLNMTRFSKQIQALQPELEKLKRKYEHDPKQMQQEQLKLWREKNINPASFALGCLPMLLQMPIWIALYAMLYYAIELRQAEAFWGFFQLFGGWLFLADLSMSDQFIKLADGGFQLPLIGFHVPYAINLLPLLMGATWIIQQRLTAPPPATPEQAQQQKIMQFMMLLFPIFLYGAPSGLTLYIMVSTLGGIAEGYYVRKQIKRMEEEGTFLQPPKRKPGGFMDRMAKAVEQKQKDLQSQQAKQAKRERKKRR